MKKTVAIYLIILAILVVVFCVGLLLIPRSAGFGSLGYMVGGVGVATLWICVFVAHILISLTKHTPKKFRFSLVLIIIALAIIGFIYLPGLILQ